MHILLVQARKFAVQLISLACFADIKLGLPLCDSAMSGVLCAIVLARVAVIIVKETEERGEGALRSVKVALEEDHFE